MYPGAWRGTWYGSKVVAENICGGSSGVACRCYLEHMTHLREAGKGKIHTKVVSWSEMEQRFEDRWLNLVS